MDIRIQGVLHQVKTRPSVWISALLVLLILVFTRPILNPPPGQAPGGADIRGLFIPWISIAREALHENSLPLWDRHQSAGYPFLANPQVAFFYPPTWLAFALPIRIALGWHIALHLFILATGVLLFSRAFHASWIGALLAALTVTFSGFSSARILAGHIGLLATFSWLPWLLFGTIWATRHKSITASLLCGLPLGLAILAGHTTSLLYVGFFWLALCAYLAWTTKSWIPIRNFIITGFVGCGLASVQLFPLIQFTQFSSRLVASDFQFASEYSLPVTHLPTLLLPEYFGEPTTIGYWSVPVFEEYAYYAGVLPLVALSLAWRRPTRRAVFLTLVALTAIWLALGRNSVLFELLYDLLPPFRVARAPARAAVLFNFSVAFLLADTLTNWQDRSDEPLLASTLRATVSVGLVLGIVALAATTAVFATLHPADTSGRLWHQIGGWSWLLVFTLLSGLLLRRFLGTGVPPVRRLLFGAALTLLVLADLWHFGQKFVRVEPTAPVALWTEAAAVLNGTELRVLPWGVSIFEQNGASRVGLDSVFGYNALALAANDRLTGSVPDPRSTAYDLLSTGFVISGVPLEQFTEGERGLALVHSSPNVWIYERSRSMPLVRMVSQVEVISDEAEAISRIHEPGFDPERVVILPESPECMSQSRATTGQLDARLISRSDTRWLIETDNSNPAVLVVSESAYPGWHASIDGRPATSWTAYAALRAVCVPAGEHVVEWEYRPSILIYGSVASGTTIILVSVAATYWWRRQRRQPRVRNSLSSAKDSNNAIERASECQSR